LSLELSGDRRQLWLSVQTEGAVRAIGARLADGRALPSWVRMDGNGFLAIDRPADVQRLRLRLTLVPERGAPRSVTVELDFDSGQMRIVGGRPGQPGAAHRSVAAPDFAAQLDDAAARRSFEGTGEGEGGLFELLRSLEALN